MEIYEAFYKRQHKAPYQLQSRIWYMAGSLKNKLDQLRIDASSVTVHVTSQLHCH